MPVNASKPHSVSYGQPGQEGGGVSQGISSGMCNMISTATCTSWARGHSLEFWNTQQWQKVRATRPRRARNHTRIPARALPFQGHVLAVEVGYGGDHRRAFLVAQGDKTSATATHQLPTARQTTCRASMPATLHSDRNSHQRPAT